MSSQALELALAAADNADRESIRAIAEADKEGVIVRDISTGLYEVISEEDLKQLLENDANEMVVNSNANFALSLADKGQSKSLSLARTQALRKFLNEDDADESKIRNDKAKGFDPYNRS